MMISYMQRLYADAVTTWTPPPGVKVDEVTFGRAGYIAVTLLCGPACMPIYFPSPLTDRDREIHDRLDEAAAIVRQMAIDDVSETLADHLDTAAIADIVATAGRDN